jgi:hypothetical protein
MKKPITITPHRVRKKEILRKMPFDSMVADGKEPDEDGIAFWEGLV